MSPNVVSLASDPSVLSKRERQVLVGLAKGFTNREIAEAVEPPISVKTVDTHRSHALKKLGLRNNSDLTRYAIRHALIDVDGGDVEVEGDGPAATVAAPKPIVQPRSAIAQVQTS